MNTRWEVEYTDEFGTWWNSLREAEQEDVDAVIKLLEAKGPQLSFPYSSGIEGAKYTHLRELRVSSNSNPIRVLYAFDPRRMAILLIGGNKRGNDRWYNTYVPIAEKLYTQHIEELKKEGLL